MWYIPHMTSPSMLNPKSSVPLYLQLKTMLFELIKRGELKPHDRIPSERELGDEFKISRMTVRQTTQALIQEGILYTRVGKGTYVRDIRLDQDHSLTGFSEEMQKRGMTASSKVLGTAIIPADAKLASMLELDINSAVIRISRLRLANEQVIAMETTHLPQTLVPNLLRHDFTYTSLYTILRQEYGINLVTAEQTVEAALANREERRVLNLQSPAAVLQMERVTRTDQNIVAEFVDSVYRGDCYKLTTTLLANSFR